MKLLHIVGRADDLQSKEMMLQSTEKRNEEGAVEGKKKEKKKERLVTYNSFSNVCLRLRSHL